MLDNVHCVRLRGNKQLFCLYSCFSVGILWKSIGLCPGEGGGGNLSDREMTAPW